MKTIDLIAHRGESADAPENTLAAFRLAWERGAVGIEGDFRLNADGEIVCMHDGNARRTTGVDLEISAASTAEVAALDAGILKGEQWKGEDVLAAVRRQLPDLKALLLTGIRQGDDGTLSPTAAELVAKLQELDAHGVDAGAADCLDAEYVEAVRARGFEFHVWTVDDIEKARRLVGIGVDSITSNRAHYLAQGLA